MPGGKRGSEPMELPIAPSLLSPVLKVDFALAWIVLHPGGPLPASCSAQWATWLMASAAAGLMLLLTTRAALSDAGQWILLLCLAGALLAHLAELALRPGDQRL